MSGNIPIRMIKLKSSDGMVFVVPETVARQSQMINRLIEDNDSKLKGVVHLGVLSATAEVLEKVITYCMKHAAPTSDEELDNWDKQFVDVDPAMLCSLLVTARHLQIGALHDLVLKKMDSNTIIKMIKLKSSDGVVFEVLETIMARQSDLIKGLGLKEEGIQEEPIPVPDATAEILEKVITFCKKNAIAKAVDATKTENEEAQEASSTTQFVHVVVDEKLNHWNRQFVNADVEMLKKIRKAAFYLEIEGLILLTCEKLKDIWRWSLHENCKK